MIHRFPLLRPGLDTCLAIAIFRTLALDFSACSATSVIAASLEAAVALLVQPGLSFVSTSEVGETFAAYVYIVGH